MEQNRLKEILNAVYELEGLVQLSLNGRQNEARLLDLMVDKATMVRNMCEQLRPTVNAPAVAAETEPVVYTREEEHEPMPAPEPQPTAPQQPLFCKAAPLAEHAPTTSAPKAARPPLRRLFPLNEIFLFRRELFGGSDEDFNASLAIVAEMVDYQQAEGYFYQDLQWNPVDPNVEHFMSIIKKHFRK